MLRLMSQLPAPLSAGPVTGWRVDYQMRASTWDGGKGGQTDGGRWNPEGFAAAYCSIDPATAILEVAVHRRFSVLDTMPHVLTSLEVLQLNPGVARDKYRLRQQEALAIDTRLHPPQDRPPQPLTT